MLCRSCVIRRTLLMDIIELIERELGAESATGPCGLCDVVWSSSNDYVKVTTQAIIRNDRDYGHFTLLIYDTLCYVFLLKCRKLIRFHRKEQLIC